MLPAGGVGNLIAAPLYGKARKNKIVSDMASTGALFYRPNHHRRLVAPKEEISDFLDALDEDALDTADGMLRRPHPAPDRTSAQGGHVSSVYSDEVLRSLVEQVYADALVIYHDLIGSWFPAFAPTLGLASILPVAFEGKIVPRADGWGGPDFLYHMTPLPLDQPSSSSVRLMGKREDLNVDRQAMFEEYRRLRQRIAVLHPGAEGWARPRSADATLWVYGDMPSTALAYGWLWEDLRALYIVKNNPPSDMNP